MKNTNTVCSSAKRASARSLPLLMAILGLFASVSRPMAAAEPLRPGEWWGTFELGGGQLDRKTPGFSDNSGRFYLGLEGGVAVDPHVLLGVELSGWLIQSEDQNDPKKGSGISQVFAVARIYPQPASPFHIQLGAGSINGWDNSPSGSTHNGSGWEAGIGYDAMFSTHGAITPFLRYNSGKAGNLKLSAVTIGVGFTWR